jgi:hypothetical protein
MQRQTIGFLHKTIAEYMVKVAMCIQEVYWFEVILLYELFQLLLLIGKITPRVYNTTVPFLVVYDICIFLYWIESKCLNR